MKKHIAFLWRIIILCPVLCKSQEVRFMPVHFPERYQHSTIRGIAQDSNGCTWFADGVYGLFRYDGISFVHYTHSPYSNNSLGSDLLMCVLADKGYIWIGTKRNGLERLEPESKTFTHFVHNDKDSFSLCSDAITALLLDRDGTLWIATANGLDRMDGKTGKFIHIGGKKGNESLLKHEYINTLYQDRSGVIWIGCGSNLQNEVPLPGMGGLYKLDKKTENITHYLHKDNDAATLIDNRVSAIYEDSRSVFWVGTADYGVHIMDRKSGTFKRFLYTSVNPGKHSRPPKKNTNPDIAAHVTFINEDIQRFIWIGSFENGLSRYSPVTGITTHFGKNEKGAYKTNTDNYWACLKTKDHVLWMSCYSAVNFNEVLYRVTPSFPQISYTHLGKQPYSFAIDADSSIWLGTTEGKLLHVKKNKACDTFSVGINKTKLDKHILFLESTGTNSLWVSTFGNGLYNFNVAKGIFNNYGHIDGNTNSLSDNTIFATHYNGNGKLWIGTFGGLDLLDIKTNMFTHYKSNPKDSTTISNDFINNIKTDGAANVWVGTLDGINQLSSKTKKWRQYLKGNNIFDIMVDSHNRIWTCTQNSGLYLYYPKTDKFIRYYDTTGIINDDNIINSLIEDRQHYLWLSTHAGFIKLNPETKAARFYGKSWGIGKLNSLSFISRQGEIFGGESEGYYHFFPKSLNEALSADQPPYISQFYLGSNPVKPGTVPFLPLPLSQTERIKLKYNQSNFTFEFNYVDFISSPEDINIEYKLQNYDDGWRKSGEEKKGYYYNVPPGKYIFKIKALNMFGKWAEKSITLIITPPWWQTWWAYVLYGAVAAGSVLGFIELRSRRLKKENRLLEQKIKLRTKEVMEQKGELTVQRDNLEKTLGELKSAQKMLIQSEKMASLGELTSGIAHEIQNPLNFVNNFSEVSIEMLAEMATELNSGDKEEAIAIAEDLKQTLEKINQHGKRADSIVKGMLQHSRTSTGIKEITDINKLADEYMRLSYHGLRTKDKLFNAEMTTHFDKDLPKIEVVPQDISRVLLNLFNNAFYAVNQKTKMAGADYKPGIIVTTYVENGQVIIKIKDNGTGIPDAIKDKIMQPFFTTKPTGEGTGLGLSLSYDIVVKEHGGSIDISSVEGGGSEFIIKLPFS